MTMLVHNTTIVRDGKRYAHGDEIQVSAEEQVAWSRCLRPSKGKPAGQAKRKFVTSDDAPPADETPQAD